jgi:hypothetical protein
MHWFEIDTSLILSLKRTTTLGGYVIDEGIRIYSKNTNGDCREACNSLTTGAISAACVERDKRAPTCVFFSSPITNQCLQASLRPGMDGSQVCSCVRHDLFSQTLKSHTGEFKLSAHPASAICAFGVGNRPYVSILCSDCPCCLQWRAWPWDAVVWYQSITGEIRGRRHEQRGWVDCEYSVSDALKGWLYLHQR